MKYTFKQFDLQFPDDCACLDFVYRTRFPKGATCECGKSDCFHPVKNRRAYACAWCGAQLYPTEGTIFHKSSTSMKSWFFAMFLMSTSKNGVAAKEIQRHVGVTYKCAWRMAHQIRKLMAQSPKNFTGTVEGDETYCGGKQAGKRGRGAAGKTPVVGLVERRGDVVAKVVDGVTANNVIGLMRKNVAAGATFYSDELPVYNYAPKFGYQHSTVCHGAGEYVNGRVHTNTIEGFWSQVKRSIDGTHHGVSRKFLQNYVDEFAYRYNLRFSEQPIFELLAQKVATPMPLAA